MVLILGLLSAGIGWAHVYDVCPFWLVDCFFFFGFLDD